MQGMGRSKRGSQKEEIQVIKVDDIDFKYIPIAMAEDVKNRVADWLAAGGKPNAPYVQKQLQYLKNIEKAVKKEEQKYGKINHT